MTVSIKSEWRRSALIEWAMIVGVYAALTAVFAVNVYYARKWNPESSSWSTMTWADALMYPASDYMIWALLTPFVLMFARKYPFDLKHWQVRVLQYAGAFLLICTVYSLIRAAVNPYLFTRYAETFAERFQRQFIGNLNSNVFMFGPLVLYVYAKDYYARFREREMRTAQLQAQLAEAELQMLKMQLQPHFLFNTLNSIAALMREDVDSADDMMSDLSMLLRMTLDGGGVHEVPLQQELEILKPYLRIQRTRFQDRLTVDMDVDAAVMQGKVPSFILQPIVENAVRHGIAPRSGPGHILVQARREGERLVLKVVDNGVGLATSNGRQMREGIGLSNTRARLQQLYGAQYQLIIRNGRTAGVEVELQIPFRTEFESLHDIAEIKDGHTYADRGRRALGSPAYQGAAQE